MKKIILGIIILVVIAVIAGIVWNNKSSIGRDKGDIIVDSHILGKTLDLSNSGIDKIPQDVFLKTQLEDLNVSNNKITGAIQAEIRNLQNLKSLNASNNQMTGVPAEIGQLQNLVTLDLSNNQLTGLPQELGNLKNLKTLNISGNNYSQQDLDYIKSKLSVDTNIITK